MKLPNLIILGPQGSGKGTQAELLAKRYGYDIIGMGKLLRERGARGDKFGNQIKKTIDSGRLVSGVTLARVLREALKAIPEGTPLIFDGVPRDLAQVKMFEALVAERHAEPPRVIVIKVSRATAIERIKQRRTCDKCARPIGLIAKIAGKIACPACGHVIQIRADDSAEAIERRLNIYYENTVPVIEYYRAAGRVIEVDGSGTIDEVHQLIVKSLDL